MIRLTDEMENRARETNCSCQDTECQMKDQMLTEIDTLRVGKDKLSIDLVNREAVLGQVKEERDQLRAKLDIAVEALEYYGNPNCWVDGRYEDQEVDAQKAIARIKGEK